MYKNQYVISSQPAPNLEVSGKILWNTLNVYLGSDTTYALNDKCLIIGKAANSFFPDKNLDDIAKDVSKLSSNQSALCYFDDIAGRYIALINCDGNIIAITDACGFKRGLFFENDNIKLLTSSERYADYLFGVGISIPDEVQEILEDSTLQSKESPWFGLSSYDSRFKYIIPNHFLKWSNFSLLRMSVPKISDNNTEDKILSAAKMISNTIIGLSEQYKLLQPITAGVDSRVLLAASIPVKEKVNYYLFSNNNSSEDVRVAKELSSLNNNSLSIVQPASSYEDNEFVNKLKTHVLSPRFLPKTDNIFYHLNHTPQNWVNINGNGSEITRVYHGKSTIKLNYKSLAVIQGVDKWPILTKGIEDWFRETNVKSFAKKNNLSISDLFYWEQRMPMWGSMYPFEQDIAIDEVSPFSNRKLLYILLSIPDSMRSGPKYSVSKRIIDVFKPELNTIPYNPDSSRSFKGRIRTFVKKDPLTIILARKIMNTFSKKNN